MKPPRLPELDRSRLRARPLASYRHKVKATHFASDRPVDISAFLEALPPLLAAEDFRALLGAIRAARRKNRPVVLACGGHVVKCGLGPLVCGLMRAGWVTGHVINGSGSIHDYELALAGETSEDVDSALHAGRFGFADETARGIFGALRQGLEDDLGYGAAVGRAISRGRFRHRRASPLATAWELGLPATVHAAIGCETLHQHPAMDGALVGRSSQADFELLCRLVAGLEDGGVWLHFGSAVILPECFLKAVSVCENLGRPVRRFTAAVFDFQRHYRCVENVVRRPTAGGGRGFYFLGHHELWLPLLYHALLGGKRPTRKAKA